MYMTQDAHLIAEAYYGKLTEINHSAQMAYDATMKTLVTGIARDPGKFWEVLKKVPGMYGALLTGNMQKVQEIYLSLGVDVNQIHDAVQKSMELFAEYQRDPASVQIRKALPVQR
jgi:hypothetical protein